MKLLTSCLDLLVQLIRIGMCVFFIYWSVSSYTDGEASKSWPTVKGKLTTAEMKKVHTKTGVYYEADVKYTYTVKGRTFTSSEVQFGGLTYRDQEKLLRDLKSAKQLNVHYHPEHPEICCLETGPNMIVVILGFVGAILFACIGLEDHFKARKRAGNSSQSWTTNRQGKKLSAMPGLREQKDFGLANSEASGNKKKAIVAFSALAFVGIIMAAINFLESVEFAGIPPKVLSIGVIFFGGLSIVMLISSIAPTIGLLMRHRHLQLAEMLASFNALIYSGFSSSFELALARGLQAEIAQERLQYDKALSLSKQALSVMAERNVLFNSVMQQQSDLGVMEKQIINSSQKQHSSLESVCNESLGCIYFDMGKYDDAMKHAKDAIKMAEDLLKDQSTDNPSAKLALACGLTLKGRIENILGSLDSAKADLKRAMSIRQEVKLPYPDRLALVMANLASTNTMLTEYRAAEKLLDDGLKIVEGSNEPAMELARATVLFHRAELKMHLEQYGKAEGSLNECIAIREKLLLPNHPHIAEAYLASATVSQFMGKSAEAALKREKATAMLKFCFGAKHPLIPTSETLKSSTNSLRQKGMTRA